MHRLARIFLLIGVCLFAVGCREIDRVEGGTHYNWYTLDEDIALGEEVLASALAQGRETSGIVIDAPELQPRLARIAGELAAVSHYPELPWELHTMNAAAVNAWCAPGGKIMVYVGLFVQAGEGFVDLDDEDEIAAVLGHEIAHATCRHVTRSQSVSKTVWWSLFPAYLVALVIVPELTSVWDLTFQGGFGIWSASYSRGDEAQADIVGAEYAARAGYDPRAALRIWARADELYGSDFELYGSHPPNDERVALLEAEMPRLVELYERVRGGEDPPAWRWDE